MGLRLVSGAVTVVLADDTVRRRLMAMLDDTPGSATGAVRVSASPETAVPERLARLRAARGADLVLVDRLTDGLDAATRRVVLSRVRGLTAGGSAPTAVLVDDADPVAALAVADRTLRVDPLRGLVVEPADPARLGDAGRDEPDGLDGTAYRAS